MLITGCARSGTSAITRYLAEEGLDVGHETNLGRDGIASWFLARRDAVPPSGHAITPRYFDRVVHLVRNPVDCIASLATLSFGAWKWVQQYMAIADREIPSPERECGPIAELRYWIEWNRFAEGRADERWCIEDCDDHGLGKDINARPHGPAYFDACVFPHERALVDQMRELAQRYGYVL